MLAPARSGAILTPISLSAVSPTIEGDRDEQRGAQHRQKRAQARRVRRSPRLPEPGQAPLNRYIGEFPDDHRREHRQPDRDQSRQDTRPDLASLQPVERLDTPKFEKQEASQNCGREMHERPRNRHPAARARLRPDQQTERRGCLGSRLGRAVEQPDHDQRDEPPPDDDQDRAEQHPDPAGTGLKTGRPCDPAHRDREQRRIMPDRGQPVAPLRCGLALRRRAEMGGDRGPRLPHHDPQKHRDDEADKLDQRRIDGRMQPEQQSEPRCGAAERRDQRQPAQPTHQIRGAIVIDKQQPQAARIGRQQHAADRKHYPGGNVGIDHDLDRQACQRDRNEAGQQRRRHPEYRDRHQLQHETPGGNRQATQAVPRPARRQRWLRPGPAHLPPDARQAGATRRR